ncbi:hypothetical protein H4CHR_06038 [Variovorax sp. PBS-H4]|nr:hypothetical protein H4CHR_06038 [Variovorax sp. PBS-H4]
MVYGRPGFQIRADGTVLVAPEVSAGGPANVHQLLVRLLHSEDPETRAFIIKAIESDRCEVDVAALRDALRLSADVMKGLRKGFDSSSLRKLGAEEPPCSSSPRAVVETLQREVDRMRSCLSLPDVLTLAKFAAREIARRFPAGERIPDPYQARQLYQSMTAHECFQGRTLHNDSLFSGTLNAIDMEVAEQLAEAHDPLAPLLSASARWLDRLLVRAADTKVPLTEDNKKDLAKAIGTAYCAVLGHSFCLGEEGPQHMNQRIQHHVHVALDKLGPGNRKRGPEDLEQPPATRTFGDPAQHTQQQAARVQGLHMAASARAMLSVDFEFQAGLRCLQHAFNNGWTNWLALHRPELPFEKLSLPNEAQELSRIDAIQTPDGYPMQRLRLMPRQWHALMPELEAHLDLAIVFKGPTNLQFGDSQVHQTHHYTALINVNGVCFELESMAPDDTAAKRWLPSLQDYLESLQGGVYMAIRGDGDHPLSKYVKLMAIELFWRTCEALGVLLNRQPIIELAKSLPLNGREDAARQIDADFAAAFCRGSLSLPHAASHQKRVPEGLGRSQEIVSWLDTLGSTEAILWTGTDPMVVAVARAASGEWLAFDSATRSRRSLWEVLNGQQALFKRLAPDEHMKRAGFARALTVTPRVVRVTSPKLVLGAAQASRPVEAAGTWVLRPPGNVEKRISQTSSDPAVLASQQVMLHAFQQYSSYSNKQAAIRNLKSDPTVTTGAQAIERVVYGKLTPAQYETLLTMARNWQASDPIPGGYLATLFLTGRRAPKHKDLLELLPDGFPLCLVPFAQLIRSNVSGWSLPNRKLGNAVLVKLGLMQIVDLT